MTVSSQICKRIYQADGQNRQWTVDFAYSSANELKVYVTDASGVETDVTAHCMWDEVEHEMVYPTVDSEQEPLPAGSTVTIIRVTTPTQSLHLTQQGVLDASALERGFDKLTLHVQELAEQAQRSIKYPVSSNKTDVDAQTFLAQLQSAQTEALNSALENVAATKNQLQQDLFDERTARQQADGELQSALSAKQNALNVEGQQAVSSGINAAKVASYNTHLLDTNNPHRVTKAQVGLNNVDNTSDVNKPISTATQAALNAKQNSLTTAQQAAIDSGVTSAAVAQVQTNKEDIAALEAELGEKREWQKPADWIDIRSGALPNSVYFLVGHSADYATYPTFVVKAGVSNSGTYDVFVDGIKQATTASGTETTLNWQTLALESGWDVTYPASLKTHVVRVTPTLNTNNLTSISTGSISDKGILWAHFTTTNYISLYNFAQSSTSPNANTQAPVWESVTSENNELNVSNIGYAFSGIRSLKNIPTLIAESNQTGTSTLLFITRTQIKKVKLVNVRSGGSSVFRYCPNLEEINLENCIIGTGNAEYILQDTNSLRKMPSIDFSNTTNLYTAITKMPKLEPTFCDFSVSKSLKILGCYGTSALPSYGIKGVTVSNEAPFDSTTSPQINVAYTGLDRTALVNLFKSMPYNVGYEVVGSPTITDGVASGFSGSDYPQLSAAFPTFDINDDIEIMLKATFSSDISGISKSLFGSKTTNSDISIETDANGRVYGYIYNSTNSQRLYTRTATGAISASGTYWINYRIHNGSLTISSSADKTTWVSSSIQLPSDFTYEKGTVPVIGGFTTSSSVTFFNGSIDLNETYIKVNGVPWFTGKEAMTKTCNIVGCTGTADLTQEDKNIVLDKGWQLTVA